MFSDAEESAAFKNMVKAAVNHNESLWKVKVSYIFSLSYFICNILLWRVLIDMMLVRTRCPIKYYTQRFN